MRQIKTIIILLFFVAGCRDKYDLPETAMGQPLLVVEGNLNTGTGPTRIRLTKSTKLERFNQIVPELHAIVNLKGDDNTTIPFVEDADGYYQNTQLSLVPAVHYRLHIRTTGGKEYLSDMIEQKTNTPIDSLTWKEENAGVAIMVNTHDPSTQTRYYRWDYTETWEIHSVYEATVKWENQQVLPMVPPEQTYQCWRGDISNTINIATSSALQEDVIRDQFLLRIPRGTDKLSWKYSVLVRQYALTKGAYEFYKQMKQNTESMGTIFDPQPTELRGNIHNINDPDEIVIGYITASPVQEKRIFLHYYDVSNWGFQMECDTIQVPLNQLTIYFPNYLPFQPVLGAGGNPVYYLASYPTCVDCRTRGGSTVKPSFW
jgi:hypothetical protein